jgi:asparagine synthase (glutamine-hydrolysing)
MHRYIVMMWNPALPRDASVARRLRHKCLGEPGEWKCALDAPGIFAIHVPAGSSCNAIVLPRQSGILFGTIFDRQTADPVPLDSVLDTFPTTKLFESRGAYLVDTFWGHYVAFFNNARTHRSYAMRDCSGKVPCLLTEIAGVKVYFAYFEDAVGKGLLPPLTVNRDFLLTYLYCTEPHTAACGFDQVSQLLSGESLETSSNSETRWFSWDPRRIWKEDLVDDYSRAKDELTRVTQACVNAHSQRDRTVLLQLSGGFDSTLVLASSRKAPQPPRLTCVTRYADGPEEDERPYARMAAAAFDAPLLETKWSDAELAFDGHLFDTPPIARPSLHLLFAREFYFRAKLAESIGATAVWSGEGGDHLFIRGLGVPYAADYARAHGVSIGLLREIANNARYSRVSLWAVCRQVFNSDNDSLSSFGTNPTNAVEEGAFLNLEGLTDEVRATAKHPWLSDLEGVPIGKQWQVQELADLLNRDASMLRRSVFHNAPLISQPLMELSLRIPSYLHLKGGRHRGLARDAFSHLMPQAIVDRDSKGSTNSVVAGLFGAARGYIRDLLLTGYLAQEDLVSKTALDSATTPGKPLALRHMFPLMSVLAAEVWARTAHSISTNARRTAAR